MAAALDRAQGPALSRKALAGRKPRRQAHLCAGRAGFRRQLAIRALHSAARRARRTRDAARASAAGRPAAREPARHHRARRSRRSGALSLRRRAAEPAAPVQDAARNHSRRRALSARAGARRRERWKKRLAKMAGLQGRRGLGRQSRARQRSPPLDRSQNVAPLFAVRGVRSRACNSARARPI